MELAELLNARVLARIAALGALGVFIGLVGTAVHRARPPWGIALALLIVLSAAVLARGWAGWLGMLVLAMAIAGAVGVLAVRGPGGDVLVPAQPIGYVWYAGALAVALVALLPRRWFSDQPLGNSRG